MHLSNNRMVTDGPSDLQYVVNTDPVITAGKDIYIKLNIKNRAPSDLPIRVMIGGNVIAYNGIPLEKLPIKRWDISINRHGCKQRFVVLKETSIIKPQSTSCNLSFAVKYSGNILPPHDD